MVKYKIGTILVSHTTKAGIPIRYKVVAIADGDKKYGLRYEPLKGTLIVKRVKKDGSVTGKNKMWAQ